MGIPGTIARQDGLQQVAKESQKPVLTGELMHPDGTLDDVIRKQAGYIDRVEGARAATVLAGHIDVAAFRAGSGGLFGTQHSEHVLCPLSGTPAFECGGLRPEHPNIVFGEQFAKKIDAHAGGNVVRA